MDASQWILAGAGASLATYALLDLVPDFIPVAGHLDDAVIVVLALRILLRGGGRRVVTDHWPGSRASLGVVLRLAF